MDTTLITLACGDTTENIIKYKITRKQRDGERASERERDREREGEHERERESERA